MCGNILFVLNEYVNMIVDSILIGDNHLEMENLQLYLTTMLEDSVSFLFQVFSMP